MMYAFTGMIPCPYDEDFRCPTDGACVRSYRVCDGYNDCNYGEDEENCSMCIIILYLYIKL